MRSEKRAFMQRPHWLLIAFLLLFLFPLGSVATSGGSLPRIGWIYRIEGHLDGAPVLYVGSATDLKQRLSSSHQWAKLLQQDGTKVYAMEVFAELNVQASNRQTLLSARNEALRAAEQRAMEQARSRVENVNRRLPPGEKGVRMLNEINASTDAASWGARHRVTIGESWSLLERRSVGVTSKAIVALTILDFYWMYREAKMGRYVMAPYVLGDENGFFTLEKSRLLVSSVYHKVYLSGGGEERRVEVSATEFRALKEEAESLWGTTDLHGDFVPGLLNRKLPLVERQDDMRMD
ncbi:hypothetical protein [Cystobacter fuscus]|uniref:hypothetical protein n=1 Tax=Cystobacter fuscus TaxID=43 RepID=UPI002B2BA168|nr:GIY-YIG nuclease family protein [Cystobacter fuscus]